jgi:uncharacterized protein (TIGR00730 family)
MAHPALAVYCGSRTGHNPAFQRLAQDLGREMAKRQIPLVYGGGGVGLMGITARACLADGGYVTGVIPHFLYAWEVGQEGLSEMIKVETMHERKALMLDKSAAVVAIPGGIGTLDELIEAMTWRELKIHKKPIYLLGPEQYWQPFLDLLRHIQAQGFAPDHLFDLIEVVETLEDLFVRFSTLQNIIPAQEAVALKTQHA